MERTKEQDAAEAAALGSALLDAAVVVPHAVTAGRMTADMFYHQRNQVIFAAILEMFAGGRPIDILTLTDWLSKKGNLEKAGGNDYLVSLLEKSPTAEHGAYYMALVRDEWMRRRIIELSRGLHSRAVTGEEPGRIALEGAESFSGIIGEIQEREKNAGEIIHDLIDGWRRVKSGEKLSGIDTPFPTLNKILGGGLRTGLYLVAGRPSQGKSVLEENIALHAAKNGHFVGRVAIDMPVSVVWARTLSREGGVSLPRLNSGHAGESQLARLSDEAGPMVCQYPMRVKGGLFDIAAITSWARAMKVKHGLALLTIDYLQNIQISAPGAGYWQEVQKMTYISGTLKRLALELDIPILAVSQLTRDNERDDRPPRLSDLRGSGSLEQDATVAIFVYKDEKVAKKMGDEQKKKRPTNVDVMKQQNGETGIIQCWLHAHYFIFEECGPEGFGFDE
jgi:replicative DNA helicase